MNPLYLLILVILLCAVLPIFPHSRQWGYGPTGIVGVICIVLVIVFLLRGGNI